MDQTKTVSVVKVLERVRATGGTWRRWKQVYADENNIQIIFDFDEETICFEQKDKFVLQIRGYHAQGDSYRGNYLELTCMNQKQLEFTVLAYGIVQPITDNKRVIVKNDTIQTSYFFL